MTQAAIDLDKGGGIPQVRRVYLGPTKGWVYVDSPFDIEFVMTATAGAISSGYKGGLVIPNYAIINNWVLTSDLQGSIVIDVWKTPLTTYVGPPQAPPTVANTITGSALPTLTNAYATTTQTLTGWNTVIDQNDFLGFNVNSCSGILRCTIVLRCVTVIGQWSGVQA